MAIRVRRLSWAVAVTCLASMQSVVGCSNSNDSAPRATGSVPGVTVAAVSGRNIRLTWQPLASTTQVLIERQDPGGTYREVARKAGDHGRFLDLALQPSTTYRYRLSACNGSSCAQPTEPDPLATLPSTCPPVTITVPPAADVSDEIAMFGVSTLNENIASSGHMMAVDRNGVVVWEHENYAQGLFSELAILPDHAFLVTQLATLLKLDLDGTELYRFTGKLVHHSVRRLSTGQFGLLFFDRLQRPGGDVWLGDGIGVLNADNTTTEWQWLARDHIDPSAVCSLCIQTDPFHLGKDWTHGNAVDFDEAAHKIHFAPRNLNRIYQIDYPSGNVDWVMGDGGDFGAGLWSHAHGPEYLPDNHVLLFDNGCHRAGNDKPYSRVIDVVYDPVAKTASIDWEYRETPDFYAEALGAVHKQANGNVFVSAGAVGRLLEVTPDKQKAWEMSIGDEYGSYKAVLVPREYFTEW